MKASAPGCALPLRPLARLDQGQEPERAGGAARGGGGVGGAVWRL